MNRGLALLASSLVSIGALAQTTTPTRDPVASNGLTSPGRGGPTTLRPNISLLDLTLRPHYTDYIIRTGIGDLPLTRILSSNGLTWSKLPASTQWFDAADSSVVNWFSALGPTARTFHDDSLVVLYPGNSTGLKYITMYAPSGDVVNALVNMQAPTNPLDGPQGARITIDSYDAEGEATFTYLDPAAGSYQYEVFKHVYTKQNLPDGMFRLKAVYGPSNSWKPICTLQYPDTPAQKAPRPTALSCYPDRLIEIDWQAGVVQPRVSRLRDDRTNEVLVEYQYAGAMLTTATQFPLSDGPKQDHRFGNYSFTASVGSANSLDLATTSTDAINTYVNQNPPCVGGNNTWWAVGNEQSPGASTTQTFTLYATCPPRLRTVSTSAMAPSGDLVTTTYTIDPLTGTTNRADTTCSGGGACAYAPAPSVSQVWQPQADSTVLADAFHADYRGKMTVTTASRKCWGAAGSMSDAHCTAANNEGINGTSATEIARRAFGATATDGTDALKVETYQWGYTPLTQQQYPTSKTEPSAMVLNGSTTTTFKYSVSGGLHEVKHLDSVIRGGYTRRVGTGSSDPGSSPTYVYIGTFYFTTQKCSSGTVPDPHGRDLEIHGPCYVSGPNASDCDQPDVTPLRIRRFEYFPDVGDPGFNNGQLKAVSQAVNAQTPVCSEANTVWLTTRYGNYNSNGQATHVVDPSGVPTDRVFSGDYLIWENVSDPVILFPPLSATTTYAYSDGHMTLKTLPSGVTERYCYRVGAGPGCSGGTLTNSVQWFQRTDPSSTTETTTYTYLPIPGALPGGDLVSGTEVTVNGLATEYVRKGNRFDQLGYLAAVDALDSSGSRLFSAPALNDAKGNVLATGQPYPVPSLGPSPDFCGGDSKYWDPNPGHCTRRTYDGLDRLSTILRPDGTQFQLSYDSLGNLKSVMQSPGGVLVNYEYDDFGRAVAVQTQGSPAILMDYDAQGNVVTKSEPAKVQELDLFASQGLDGGQVPSPRRLTLTYDGVGRPLSVGPSAAPPDRQWVRYGYDGLAGPPANCGRWPNAAGRLQWRDDSFGRTWFRYDMLGNVVAEKRIRNGQGGGGSCATSVDAATEANPDTLYVRSPDGRVTSMRYPHGRWVFYGYGPNGLGERPTKVETGLRSDGTDRVAVVSNIQYGIGGKLASYDIGTGTAHAEWIRGGSYNPSGGACPTAKNTSSDGTERLWGLWVSAGANGRPFQRQYTWAADQLATETTCVLGNQTRRDYSYDATLKVAEQRTSGFAAAVFGVDAGGSTYRYQNGDDRYSQSGYRDSWDLTYDSNTRRLTEVRNMDDLSWNRRLYGYASYSGPNGRQSWAPDGGVSNYLLTITDTPLPPAVGVTPRQGRLLQFQTDDTSWGVYSAIAVNGMLYRYVYDGDGHRRLKVYPANFEDGGLRTDEFFYSSGQLIEDRGVAVTAAATGPASSLAGEWANGPNVPTTSIVMIGNDLVGRYDDGDFRHTFIGKYNPSSGMVDVTVVRYYSPTGCTTNMYGTIAIMSQNMMNLSILSTDGKCDLPTNFSQLNILRGKNNINVPTPGMVLHEYIWLAGQPVAVVRTALDGSSNRLVSPHCWRNGEYDACGTVYPVSDYLPKVVAIVDGAGRLAGSGEYDAFGRINEVTANVEVPAASTQPAERFITGYPGQTPRGRYLSIYPADLRTGADLATVFAPNLPGSAQRVQTRVNYSQITTNRPGTGLVDRTWVQLGANGATVAPPDNPGKVDGGVGYSGSKGALTTSWFDSPLDWDVRVRWAANASPNIQYAGATVRSFEYRRYQAGSQPTWVPLRFPGQYFDAETGLNENHSRFYDSTTGRYLATDPLAPNAEHIDDQLLLYARGNPLHYSDPEGREVYVFGSDAFKAAILSYLDEVLKTKTGKSVFDALARSAYTFIIVQRVDRESMSFPSSDKDAEGGAGSGGIIYFNIDRQESRPLAPKGELTYPTQAEVLIHELGHLDRFRMGQADPRRDPRNNLHAWEENTVTNNYQLPYRRERGLPTNLAPYATPFP